MAKLRQGMKRVIKVLEEGPVEFDPVMGQLTTPPSSPYTGDIQVKIGKFDLVLNRAEFKELAERFEIVAKMIERSEAKANAK